MFTKFQKFLFKERRNHKRHAIPIKPVGYVYSDGSVVKKRIPDLKEIYQFIINSLSAILLAVVMILISSTVSIFIYRAYLSISKDVISVQKFFHFVFQKPLPNVPTMIYALAGGVASASIFFRRYPSKKGVDFLISFLAGLDILFIVNTLSSNFFRTDVKGSISFSLIPELITAEVVSFVLTSFFSGMYKNNIVLKPLNFSLSPNHKHLLRRLRLFLVRITFIVFISWFVTQLLPDAFIKTTTESDVILLYTKISLPLVGLISFTSAFVLIIYQESNLPKISTNWLLLRLSLILAFSIISGFMYYSVRNGSGYLISILLSASFVIIFFPLQKRLIDSRV